MKKMIILLRSTIEDAIVENISKRRSCNQLKVWWLQTLTNKRKIMAYSKKQWEFSKFNQIEVYLKNQKMIIFMPLKKQKTNYKQIS